MPEAPELRLTADFINKTIKSTEVFGIDKSLVSKNPYIEHNAERLWLRASSNGKELLLFLYNSNKAFNIRMTMGMSGHFIQWPTWYDYPKHAHLQFRLANGKALLYIDPRRFGKWKILSSKTKWSANRGPSVFDQIEFEHHFMDRLNEEKVQNAYLLDIIMSQRLFNGVGNYLRAEIFDRANINPFQQIKDLSSLELIKLLKNCTLVAEESYALGGGQLKDWKNPNGQDPEEFRKWLKVYGKQSSCKDKSGRKFWYDSKWKHTQEYRKYWASRTIQHG